MFGKLEATAQINTSGVGLGLNICKSIIDALEGYIYLAEDSPEIENKQLDNFIQSQQKQKRGANFVFGIKMLQQEVEHLFEKENILLKDQFSENFNNYQDNSWDQEKGLMTSQRKLLFDNEEFESEFNVQITNRSLSINMEHNFEKLKNQSFSQYSNTNNSISKMNELFEFRKEQIKAPSKFQTREKNLIDSEQIRIEISQVDEGGYKTYHSDTKQPYGLQLIPLQNQCYQISEQSQLENIIPNNDKLQFKQETDDHLRHRHTSEKQERQLLNQATKYLSNPLTQHTIQHQQTISVKGCPCSKRPEVLIVDDNAFNILTLQCMMEDIGKDVKQDKALNGQEAIHKVNQRLLLNKQDPCICDKHRENFKIIFMDCNMPVMDGLKATQEIRKLLQQETNQDQKMLIVALTAYCTEEFEKKCYAAGMDSFISKPVTEEKVIAALIQAGIAL